MSANGFILLKNSTVEFVGQYSVLFAQVEVRKIRALRINL